MSATAAFITRSSSDQCTGIISSSWYKAASGTGIRINIMVMSWHFCNSQCMRFSTNIFTKNAELGFYDKITASVWL